MTSNYYPCQACNGTGYVTQIERGEQEVYVCESCGGPEIYEVDGEEDDDSSAIDDKRARPAGDSTTGSVRL